MKKKLDKKIVVSKIRKLKIPSLFIFVILLSYSCNDKYQNEQTLLNSIKLSNGIYTDNIKQLKDFFESKYNEEPEKFKSTYNKVKHIEEEIVKYSNLKTVKEKKTFIENLKTELKSLSQLNTIEFVCLTINDNYITFFDAIAENDFNRNLYLIFSEFYYYHHSVFLNDKNGLN